MDKLGQMICTYRKLNGISQEELAGIVGVSAGAVSKWERGISIPDLDVLCNLADYFQVTIEELIGRNKKRVFDIQFENEWEANRYFVALEMIECCKIARNSGLVAVEEALKGKEESVYSFLRFAVRYLLDGSQKNMSLTECKEYLIRYAESEKDIRTALMISEVIVLIFSGENEENVRELICSFLGRKYAGLVLPDKQIDRSKRIESLSLYDTGFANTGILDELITKEDYHIQLMLRQLDNDEFVQAFIGTSKEIRTRLLQNLSDRMIIFISEDIRNCDVESERIQSAQNKMVRIINSLDE